MLTGSLNKSPLPWRERVRLRGKSSLATCRPQPNLPPSKVKRLVQMFPGLRSCLGMMLLSALAVSLSLSSACGSAGTPTPEPSSLPDPQILLDGAVERLQAQQYLSFVFDHPVGNTPLAPGVALTRAEGVAELPDRYKVEVNMESRGTALRLGIISTGEAAYVTNPMSGEYMPAASAESVPFQFEYVTTLVIAMVGGLTDLEPVTEADLDGSQVYFIRGSTPTGALGQVIPGAMPDGQLPVEAWVNPDTGRLIQAQMSGTLVPGEAEDTVRLLRLEYLAEPPDISAP